MNPTDSMVSPEQTSADATAVRMLVTVATYNELENLPDLVEAIWEVAPTVDLLVIDDNSPDGTGDWCDKKAAEDSRLSCIHREGKLGLGTATIAAMQYAIAEEYTWMVNMDADFSHHPRYLPDLIAATQADPQPGCVIGSRYVEGGGVEGWPLRRRLMSRAVNLYARTLLGLTPRDCSGAFRAYRVDRLREIPFDRIISRGYSFQEEILWWLKRAGCRFVEVPITFADRQRGQSKIDSAEAVAALKILAQLGLRRFWG